MAKGNSLRITMTVEELKDYYAYLGSRVGLLRDGAAIRDLRPSEIAAEVASLQALQDRIAVVLGKAQGESGE